MYHVSFARVAEFLITLTGGSTSNLWIGLTDNVRNAHFMWMDQSPLIFTNWDKGEPTSSRNQGNTANIVSIKYAVSVS